MRKETLLLLFIFVSCCAVVLLYLFGIRDGLTGIYSGSGDGWLRFVIDKIYPRFSVEKQRFPLSFFLQKADQLIIRYSLVSLIAVILLLLSDHSEKFRSVWNNYLHSTTPIANVSFIRVLFPLVLIWIYKDVWWDMMAHYHMKLFYKPLLIFKLLHLDYPNPFFISLICILFFASGILTIINFRPVIFASLAGFLFITIEGFLNSFEKMNHGDATITYCALIFPFLIADHQKGIKRGSEFQDKWALSLITFLICLAYLLSGLEKIFIGGFSWISSATLKNYLLLHQSPCGLALINNNTLLSILSSAALIFQLGFIFILTGRYKYFFLAAGIIFHASVYILLNVGWYINSWVLSYLFFIDWSKLALMLSHRFSLLSKILFPSKK
jgi:hypothetical protein